MSKDNGFQKFREGDRVRTPMSGALGTVQAYECDYGAHFVTVKLDTDEGNVLYLEEERLEAVDDPYEYGIQSILDDGTLLNVNECDWHSREMAEKVRESRLERWKWMGVKNTAKLVKRRKAGPVEDV